MNSPVPINWILAVIFLALAALTILMSASLDHVRMSRLKQEENAPSPQKTEAILDLLNNPSRYQSTDRMLRAVLLAAGVLLVWNVRFPGPHDRIYAVILYTAAFISFGMILPAKIARNNSERIAVRLLTLQRALLLLLTPIRVLLTFFADLILKLFRQNTKEEGYDFSEEDFISMLERGNRGGSINEEGQKMFRGLFRFDDERCYEIMTPRTDVFLIDLSDPPEEYMDQLLELRYSRIPVCEDEPDNIIGILNIKDYLVHAQKDGFEGVEIRPILRDALFVPETKNISTLFVEMQQKNQHIAVLIDEFGGFSGIVTMEDILEQIVGDINDEYDEEDENIDALGDGTWLVDGNVTLHDLNEETGSDLESQNSETIGGFIMDLIGEVPKDGYVNRTVEYEQYTFTIVSVQDRRIERVKLKIGEKKEEEEEPRRQPRGDDFANAKKD